MRPECVRRAQSRGDAKALSRMGRAGGRAAARTRAAQRRILDARRILREQEEWERKKSTNESEVPIDSDA